MFQNIPVTKNVKDVDTELIIQEVKSHPILWDSTIKFYKDKNLKNEAWNDICLKLVDNYDSLSPELKKKCIEKAQTRWRSARDAYMKFRNRSKKTGPGTPKIMKYTYTDQMAFLDGIQIRKRAPSIGFEFVSLDADQEEATPAVKTEDEPHLETSVVPQISIEALPKLKRTPSMEFEDHLTEQQTALEEHSSEFVTQKTVVQSAELEENSKETGVVNTGGETKNTKRKKVQTTHFEDSLLMMLKDSKEKEDDDDRAFLRSLLPFLKGLSEEQKLLFRSEVIQTLMRVKYGSNLQSTSLTFQNSNPHNSTSHSEVPFGHSREIALLQQSNNLPHEISPTESLASTSTFEGNYEKKSE